MKRISLLKLLILLLTSMLLSCGNEKKVKIGLLMDNYLQERWVKDRAYFIQEAQNAGAEVLVESALGDANLQVDQAKKLLDKGVNVLVVVAVNREKAAEIVDAAHALNVKVLAYDRLIVNCDLDAYISFDNIKVGELQADYLIKRQPKGNYALIGGPMEDYNSYFVRLGQNWILQPFIEKGDIQLVYDVFSKAWKKEEGYAEMDSCLNVTKNKIDVVICGNDDLANGAIKALQERGLNGKVLVAGQDADSLALRYIAEDLQTITITKPMEQLAKAAVEVALQLGRNKKIENTSITIDNHKKMVPAILLKPSIINKGTLELQQKTEAFNNNASHDKTVIEEK